MANLIKIKRSNSTSTPTSLAEGELAYSEVSKNLFIGTNGGANIEVIGGKTAIDKLATIQSGAQVNTITSVAGKTGAVTLALTDLTDYSASNFVHTTGNESIGGDKLFTNNVTISGNLTINGSVTNVQTTNLEITDNIIHINSGITGDPTLDSGILFERGTQTDATLIWNETLDRFEAGLVGSTAAISLAGHTHNHSDITDFSTSVNSLISTANGSLTIDGLSNVAISSITNGQVLTWNSSSSKWVNATPQSGGASAFTSLTDVPSSYSGAATKFVKVNSAGTGLEFVADPGYLTSVSWSAIGSKPTTISGFGITDAYTKTEVDSKTWAWSAITSGVPTTLSGYGITDALSTSATIDGGSF